MVRLFSPEWTMDHWVMGHGSHKSMAQMGHGSRISDPWSTLLQIIA